MNKLKTKQKKGKRTKPKKDPWKVCKKKCDNNVVAEIGHICRLSYLGENEAIRDFVKSGYKNCPGLKEKELKLLQEM